MNGSTLPWHRIWYAVGSILGAGLSVFEVELATGQVPLPSGWAWVAPVLISGIAASFMFLPSAQSPGKPPVPVWAPPDLSQH